MLDDVKEFLAALENGTADVVGFRDHLDEVGRAFPTKENLGFIESLKAFTQPLFEAEERSRELQAAIDLMQGTATDAQKALLGLGSAADKMAERFTDAMKGLGELGLPELTDQMRAVQQLQEAMSTASGLEERVAAMRAYEAALGRIADREGEKAAQKAAEEAAAAAKQQADAIASVKEQLTFETEQLSRSAREQAIWNQLKAAGVERTSAEGQEIAALAGRLYDLETAQKAATDAQKEAEHATKALVDARAKLAGDLAFGRGTMFLSEEDVQIAQRLRDIYGDDIAAALGSAEAEAIRFKNRLKEAAAVGEAMRESLSGAIADVFTGGAKTAGEFLDSLTKGIAKAAADLLASRLTDKLFGGALAPVDVAGARVATALTGAASRVTAATPPLATAATSLSGAAGDLKQAATALSLSGGAIGAPAAPGAGLSAGVGVGGAALSAANFNLQAAAAAIKTIESLGSGGYGALGKVIANGDRAYGAYQVMGNNIASWTKAAIGYSMTNEAFLRSAEAQDKVFAHRFGLLVQQFGNVSDAASAWFTGRPLATGGASTDINGMSGNAYVDRFNKLYARGAPTVAAPANDNVASVNIASVGGKKVADAADIGGLSSSSGVGGALTKLGGVLSSPTFQQGLAGFSMGFQSQSPVMGGLGGAFSGLMAGGPVGALVGGAAGILGGILGKSRAEREAEEKAREAWATMAEEVAAFSDELRGKVTGDLGDAIASAEARFAKYRQAAKEAGEGTGSLARDLEAFTKRITREFKRSFDLQVEAYASGLGSDDPALKASQSMRALRDELLGFVADARIAGGGRAKEARIASRGYVLDQIGGGASGSTTAYDAYLAEEARIAGTRKEAIALLVELGVKEKKARQQVNAAIADALADAQKVYQEAIDDRRMGFADRLFAATTDLTTLEGQLAQFDRQAQRERERELADGGEAMADLERALAAERLKIQTDYQKQSVEAAKRAADELNRTALSIVEYVNGLRAGADSPLSPADRLAAARAAYDSQIGLAQGGNLEALGSITKYADDLLSAARDFYASSEAFQDIFDAVTGQLLGLPAVQGSSDPVVQALYQVNQTLGGLLTADQIATLGLSKDVTVGGLLKASQLVPAGLATNATLGTLLTQAQLQAAGLSRDTTVGGLLTASQLAQAGLARDATVTGVVKTGDVSALGQLPGINSAVNAVNSGVAGVATGVGDVKNGVTDEGGVAKGAKVSAKGVVPYIQPMLFRLTEH
ncbi:MAG: hypothetical protein J0H08_08750, partial [Rhizobiales bacterium]|nr:hypothetical protein [Hyphomicrobiales bacterium]